MTGSRLIPLGRVVGHRGRAGELTVKVFRGDAEHWNGVARVWMSRGDQEATVCVVDESRTYKDRLVLKLAGVDDPSDAEALRGSQVAVAAEDAPELPAGEYYRALLVGMGVVDEQARTVGRVVDVMPTGGKDVLVISPAEGEGKQAGEKHEILVPLVAGMADVDEAAGVIRIRPPEGLLELNRD